MEQNTSSKKSASKCVDLKADAKPAFNISSYFTSTTIHIAIEVVIACAFFAYFHRKINKQRDQYEARIAALETNFNALASSVNDLISVGVEKKFDGTQTPVLKIPAPETKQTKTSPPSMPLNFFQDLIAGSMGCSMLDAIKQPQMSTIEEVADESDEVDEPIEVAKKPVSREQLDKELSEELGELNHISNTT